MALTEWSLDQTMRIGDSLWLGLLYLIGLVSAKIKLQYENDRKEDFVAYAGIYMDPWVGQVNIVHADDESMEYSSGVQRLFLYFVVNNEFVYEMGHRLVCSTPGSETVVHSDKLCALDLEIDG